MPLNINVQQILLHLFNFVLLFTILYLLIYKPVKAFMDKRAASVAKIHEDAQATLAQAETVKADYEARLGAADAEIAERRAAAEAKAADAIQKKLCDAEKEAAKIVETAKQNAEAEHKRMMQDTKKDIADLANAMAEQVVTKNTSDAFDQFLKSAERGNKNA